MSELLADAIGRKTTLKRLIRALHEGTDPENAKKEAAGLLRTLTAEEIARIEGELVDEGMPREELERLCDVHLAVFQEALEREQAAAPPHHPIQILLREHELLLDLAADLEAVVEEIAAAPDQEAASAPLQRLRSIAGEFKESENHYLREENVLFPYLEKHGIVQPPAIMWSEHDRIRAIKKGFFAAVEAADGTSLATLVPRLKEAAEALATMLASHFHKENNILFPTALRVLTEEEWENTIRQFGEIGYWKVVPPTTGQTRQEAPRTSAEAGREDVVSFETGSLPLAALEPILNSLPVDITFVDDQDQVRYFSNGKERVFPRATAIIGRKVQQCHPEKSVHVVNRILEDFRSGRRDTAEFWIQSGGRFIVIRYYAVRREGKYLGCLEVTQDATGIRALEGEKRLLDG
ncbi:MAG: DUF438 domain-containing protein [Sphingomonadaceae bacterium]